GAGIARRAACAWRCGGLGEGAGGEREQAGCWASDLCVPATALLAGGREGKRRRLDGGTVVSKPSSAGSSNAAGGQRRLPVDGPAVGGGRGMAQRPCDVWDGAVARDGAAGAGVRSGACGRRNDGIAIDLGGAAGAAGRGCG